MLASPSPEDLARRRQPRVVRRRDGAPEVLEVPGRGGARAPGPVRGLDVDFYRGGRRGHPFLSAVRCSRAARVERTQCDSARTARAGAGVCGSAVSNVLCTPNMLGERVCRGFRPVNVVRTAAQRSCKLQRCCTSCRGAGRSAKTAASDGLVWLLRGRQDNNADARATKSARVARGDYCQRHGRS